MNWCILTAAPLPLAIRPDPARLERYSDVRPLLRACRRKRIDRARSERLGGSGLWRHPAPVRRPEAVPPDFDADLPAFRSLDFEPDLGGRFEPEQPLVAHRHSPGPDHSLAYGPPPEASGNPRDYAQRQDQPDRPHDPPPQLLEIPVVPDLDAAYLAELLHAVLLFSQQWGFQRRCMPSRHPFL